MGHPDERHIYMACTTSPVMVQCLTCDKFNDFTQPCLWNSASFSHDGTHYVWTCTGSYTEPLITVINTKTKETMMTWENNAKLNTELRGKAAPLQRDFWVDVDGGFKAQVRLILPHDFDEAKKYPLLIYT